jgi:hypothetical protein
MTHPASSSEAGTGGYGALLLLLVALVLLLLFTARARSGRRPQVRRIRAFDQLPAELGRAAEAGASLHFGLGTGALGGEQTATSLAGIQVLAAVADAAVAYGNPPLVTAGDPTLMALAQDTLRRAYRRAGAPEDYDPKMVRYVAPSPSVYALGAGDAVGHEHVTASVLAGSFGEEIGLLTHAAEGRGLTQMAAADRPQALSALYAADTLLAAGEELYAGAARLTGLPQHVASLQAQDWLRYLMVLLILLAALGIRVL